MNKKIILGVMGLAASGLFAGDNAITVSNPYVTVKGGYSMLSNRDNVKYKNGAIGAVEFGVSYDAWRLGLEVAYRQNKLKLPEKDKVILSSDDESKRRELSVFLAEYDKMNEALLDSKSVPFSDSDKTKATAFEQTYAEKIAALSGMVNLYYDYALTDSCSLYAGVGIGVAKVTYRLCHDDYMELTANDELKETHNNMDVGATVLAWQAMVGFTCDISENWDLEVGYRFFNTAKVKALNGLKVKAPFASSVEIGLRYNF